jgi:hypothetical protein
VVTASDGFGKEEGLGNIVVTASDGFGKEQVMTYFRHICALSRRTGRPKSSAKVRFIAESDPPAYCIRKHTNHDRTIQSATQNFLTYNNASFIYT